MDNENKTPEPTKPTQEPAQAEQFQGEIDIRHAGEPEPPAPAPAEPAEPAEPMAGSMTPPPGQVITPGQAPAGPAPDAGLQNGGSAGAGAAPGQPGTAPAEPGADPAAPPQPPHPKVQWCPTDLIAVTQPEAGNTCPACGTPLVPLPPEYGPEKEEEETPS